MAAQLPPDCPFRAAPERRGGELRGSEWGAGEARGNPDYAMFNILTPFPGTGLYQKGVAMGVVRDAPWQEFLRQPKEDFHPQVWDQFLDEQELGELLGWAWKRFYGRPQVVMRNLRQVSSPTQLFRKARAGVSLLVG